MEAGLPLDSICRQIPHATEGGKNHACDYLPQMLQKDRDALMIPAHRLIEGLRLRKLHAKHHQIILRRMSTLIVGVGGTLRAGSSTEHTLSNVLHHARALGAETSLFAGEMLNLPMYVPGGNTRCDRARALLAALRRADAIVIGSPGYHGVYPAWSKTLLITQKICRRTYCRISKGAR